MTVVAQDFYEDDEELIGEKKKKTTGDLLSGDLSGGTEVGEGGDTKSPTGFVNLEQYLEQNKPETQEMVSGLTEDIGQRAQAFTGQLGGAEEKFKERVDLGGVGYDKKLAEEFYKAPNQFTQDKDRLKKFEEMRDAQYKGPQQLSQAHDIYKPLIQSQEDLLSRAKLLRERPGQEGGRESLLREKIKRPLTAGQMALNTALIGSTPLGVSAIEASAQQAESAARDLENRRKALNEIAKRRQTETQQTAQEIQTGLSEARKSLRDTIKERIGTMKSGAETTEKEFKEALAKRSYGDLDEGEIKALNQMNISQDQFNQMMGNVDWFKKPKATPRYREIAPQLYGSGTGIGDSDRAKAAAKNLQMFGITHLPIDEEGNLDLSIVDEFITRPILQGDAQAVYDWQKRMDERIKGPKPLGFGDALQYQAYKDQTPGFGTFETEIEGREIDPSLFYEFGSPDVAYTESTVTTPEEYENLKALRELQKIETPIDFELKEAQGPISYTENLEGEEMDMGKLLEALGTSRGDIEKEMERRYWENYFRGGPSGGSGFGGGIPFPSFGGIPT